MSNFYQLLTIICLLLSMHIHAEQKLKVQVTSKTSRIVLINQETTLFIKIQNLSANFISVRTVYKIPHEVKYINANIQGWHLDVGKKVGSFLEWNISIPAQTIRVIKVKIKAIKITPRITNKMFFFYLGQEKLISYSMRIEGYYGMGNTYDTKDPCGIGEEIRYIIEKSNNATNAITNIKMTNNVPDQMHFLRAKVKIYNGKKNKRIRYKYDPIKHHVYFDQIRVLEPGDKIIYMIYCLATKEGLANNIARLKYNEFHKEIIDQEETVVHR